MSSIRDFLRGASLPFSGFHYSLKTRPLWPYLATPLLTVLIFTGTGVVVWTQHASFLTASVASYLGIGAPVDATPFVHTLVSIGRTFFTLFVSLFGLIAVAFTSIFASKLVAIPFYALLAEKTLTLSNTMLSPPFTFGRWFKENLAMLKVTLIKGLYFLILGFFILALSFIPVLNFFAIYCGLVLLAFDCFDYSLEAERLQFKERMLFLRTHMPLLSGVALTLGLVLIIPGLSFLFVPATIVGAARYVSAVRYMSAAKYFKSASPVNGETR